MSVAVRPAATVVLMRQDGSVLLVQRSRALSFFGGAYAFPGGRVDDEDLSEAAHAHPWAGHLRPAAGLSRVVSLEVLYAAYRAAAVREVREETGIVLDPTTLVPWARWITPEIETKRYDTLFFLAPIGDVEVRVDGGETIGHRWMSPDAALDAFAKGEIMLPPPTWVTLLELREHDAAAPRADVPEILPQLEADADALYLVLPDRVWPPGVARRTRIK